MGAKSSRVVPHGGSGKIDYADRPALKNDQVLNYTTGALVDQVRDTADEMERQLDKRTPEELKAAAEAAKKGRSRAAIVKHTVAKTEDMVAKADFAAGGKGHDASFDATFGITGVMPAWRRAVAKARIKASIFISVSHAFQEASGVHVQRDYFQILTALVYNQLGADLPRVQDTMSRLHTLYYPELKPKAAKKAPEPETGAAKPKPRAIGRGPSVAKSPSGIPPESSPAAAAGAGKGTRAIAPAASARLGVGASSGTLQSGTQAMTQAMTPGEPHAHGFDTLVYEASVGDKRDAETGLTPLELRGLMDVALKRANSRAEKPGMWAFPKMHDLQAWVSKEQREYGPFIDRAQGLLLEGKVAIDLVCSGPGLELNIGPQPVFFLDPWEMAKYYSETEALEFGLGSTFQHIENLPIGCRALMQLAVAVERWGGRTALGRLLLVLHVNSSEHEAVCTDLKERRHYGLKPENVWVIAEPALPALRQDIATRTFESSAKLRPESLGTGYALQQLSGRREAVTVAEDGAVKHLEGSVLDALVDRGAEWMLSGALDLQHLTDDGALDLDFLAYTVCLCEKYGGNMAVETRELDMPGARTAGTVVMRDCVKAASGEMANFSAEVPLECLQTLTGIAQLEDVAREGLSRANKGPSAPVVPCSQARYAFKLSALRKMVADPTRYQRPLLRVEEAGELRPRVMASDLSACADARCLAVLSNRGLCGGWRHKGDIPELVRVVGNMDKDKKFVERAGQLASKSRAIKIVAEAQSLRYRVLVPVQNDKASKKAFAYVQPLLKAGQDKLTLLMLAESASKLESTAKALAAFEPGEMYRMLELAREVRALDPSQKAAAGVEAFAESWQPHLVVAASDVTELGSTCIALGHALLSPLLFVKEAARVPDDKEPIKFMVALEQSSGPTLRFVLSIMRPAVDKLFLVRSALKEGDAAQASARQKMLDAFAETAASAGVKPECVAAAGKTVDALPEVVKAKKIDVLCLQAPKLKTMSDTLKKIMVAAPCSILLFKVDQKAEQARALGRGASFIS